MCWALFTLVVGSNQQGLKRSRCQCLSSLSNPSQNTAGLSETSPWGDVLHCWFPEQNWGSCLVEISKSPCSPLTMLFLVWEKVPLLYMKTGRVQADRQMSLCSGLRSFGPRLRMNVLLNQLEVTQF